MRFHLEEIEYKHKYCANSIFFKSSIESINANDFEIAKKKEILNIRTTHHTNSALKKK